MLHSIPRLALSATLIVSLASCGKKETAQKAAGNPMDFPQAVEVMEIRTMEMRETVDIVGTIEADESAELRPEIPGTIISIGFKEGAVVKKGDMLVQLDTRELEAQLAEARAGFKLAEQNLERNRLLLADDAVSRLEVDAAEAEHARLAAAIQQLEVRIAKSTLRAPFDGFAGGRSVSVGDYVTSATPVTTIDDLGRLKVAMQVPERYLPQLRTGGTFSVRASTTGEGKVTEGEVYFVSPRIDEATRSTLVKGYLKEPPADLKPGMFARVTLVLRVVPDALVVPETAVLTTPRGTVLIVPQKQNDGSLIAAFVPVRTGIRSPGLVQITPVGPPIKAGDRIVSSGVGGLILFPGRKLDPVEPVVTPAQPEATDRQLK